MIPQVLGTIIIFNSENIVEGIRRRWSFGKNPNGGIIGKYSSSVMGQEYKSYKMTLSTHKADGFVDLTLTGDLGNALTIRKNGDKQYEIFSTDYKFERIADKYGIEQFNLDQQQTEELFDMLYYMALENYIDNVWLV